VKEGDVRVVMYHNASDLLRNDAGTARLLRVAAEKLKGKVRAPSGYTTSVRAGVGRRGAFSQVIMSGHRAVFVEFGTKTVAALAPLRRAAFGQKGVK